MKIIYQGVPPREIFTIITLLIIAISFFTVRSLPSPLRYNANGTMKESAAVHSL